MTMAGIGVVNDSAAESEPDLTRIHLKQHATVKTICTWYTKQEVSEMTPSGTENTALRTEAAEQIEQICNRLVILTRRLSEYSIQLTETNKPAATVIANMLSDYTQLGYSIGPNVWTLIHELKRMK